MYSKFKEGSNGGDFRHEMMNRGFHHSIFGGIVHLVLVLIFVGLLAFAVYKFYKIYQNKTQVLLQNSADLSRVSTMELLERQAKINEELESRKRKTKAELEDEIAQLRKILDSYKDEAEKDEA